MPNTTPQLITSGRIAEDLGEPLPRVQYILTTRNIKPAARAGTLRLFDREAVEKVRAELRAIEARKLG